MKRSQYRIIYTSSYDRGLEHLLKMWPDIKKVVPKVTLRIFYGWQLFDKFHRGNPASMAWKAEVIKGMKQDGVSEHGRVPPKEIEKEYKRSGVWAYPVHFGEISCISAIKAQAYGCEPVVIDYAALKETVQFGRKIEGDIYDKEVQAEFKKQLIEALKNPMKESERKKMMRWAQKKYSWVRVGEQWDRLFKE